MIKVFVNKQRSFPVSSGKIKDALRAFFSKKGIVSDAQVNVNIVGEARMKLIAKKYLGEGSVHNILSFTEAEVKEAFIYPDNTIRLGEMYVCYPEVVREAKKEGVLIDKKVLELVEHGALHLLGEHHE